MLADLGIEPGHQRLAIDIRPIVQRHERLGQLAMIIVRHTDHEGIAHRFMGVEHILDMAGEHLEPAHRNHVLQSIDDGNEAVLVDGRHISGAQEFPVEHLGVRIGTLPIALHHLRTGKGQLARLALRRGFRGVFLVQQTNARAGDRLADGADLARPDIGIAGHHARAFGQAIAFDQLRSGGLFPAGLDRLGQRRAARNAILQRGKIGLADGRMIEQRLIHGRHAGHGHRLGALDRLQRIARIEARQHHDLAAAQHRAVEHAGIGEHMEQRQHAHDAVHRHRARIDHLDLPRIGGQVLVGQHGPLGRAGGAAGILQQGNVFGLRVIAGKFAAIVDQIGPAGDRLVLGDRRDIGALEQAIGQTLGRRQPLGHRSDDQFFERAFFQHLQRGGQQRRGIHGDEQPRAAVFHLMAQLRRAVEGREVHHHHARDHRAIIGRDIMGHIGQEQAHAVTGLHAEIGQAGGHLHGAGGQRGIAELAAHEIDQRRIGMVPHGRGEHLRHRHRRKVLRPCAGMAIFRTVPDAVVRCHNHSCCLLLTGV